MSNYLGRFGSPTASTSANNNNQAVAHGSVYKKLDGIASTSANSNNQAVQRPAVPAFREIRPTATHNTRTTRFVVEVRGRTWPSWW